MKYRLLLIDWGLPSLLASSYMDFTIDNHDFSLGAPIELMQKRLTSRNTLWYTYLWSIALVEKEVLTELMRLGPITDDSFQKLLTLVDTFIYVLHCETSHTDFIIDIII